MPHADYPMRQTLMRVLQEGGPAPTGQATLLSRIPLNHDPGVAASARRQLDHLIAFGFVRDLAAGFQSPTIPPLYQLTPDGLAQIEGSTPRDVRIWGVDALG